MLREEEIFRRLANRELTKTEALALIKQLREGSPAPQSPAPEVNTAVAEIVGKVLRLDEDELDVDRNFIELGADSIAGVEILREINNRFGLNLSAVLFYDYTTVTALAQHVASQVAKQPARQPEPTPEPLSEATVSAEEVKQAVAEIVGKVLRLDDDEMDVDRNFIDLGADSLAGVEILREINNRYGLNLNVVLFYDYTTVTALAQHVALQLTKTSSPKAQTQAKAEAKPASEPEPEPEPAPAPAAKAEPKPEATPELKSAPKPAPKPVQPTVISTPSPSDLDGVAVIGVSGRFPGAGNVRQFWKNLRDGVDAVTEVPKDRWNIDELYDPTPHTDNKTYCRTGGFLTDIDHFDPLFFNISPAEAETMDPQQRLFLQEAWRALEDAGYSDRSLALQKCGVFIGVTPSDYGKLMAEQGLDTKGEAMTGLASSILAARISYFLNLIGPNISVDTACSSSLVSVHLAVQSILSGESDMALAGGVSLFFTPEFNLQAAMMEMLSPSGKCRTFDHSADGTVFSEGVGVIVLKPLRKAIADRDHIYGVIKGTGVNQDGKTNGITAPSATSQTRLMLDIYKRFQINAADISYVEAHGTATPLGDPIEVKALSQAFSTFTDEKQYCAIGSVKTNIGHGYTASGIMALIKVLLSLQHKQIPPSLHYEKPNQHIDFADSPFYVNDKLSDWKTKPGVPRLATVSSFALSGTNAHVVVQEAPQD